MNKLQELLKELTHIKYVHRELNVSLDLSIEVNRQYIASRVIRYHRRAPATLIIYLKRNYIDRS